MKTIESADFLTIAELGLEHRIDQRFSKFVGGIAMSEVAQIDQVGQIVSLQDSIDQIAEGNIDAYMSARANVATMTYEAVNKAGEVITTRSQILPDGQFMQYGTLHANIYANTLKHRAKHPIMRQFAESETRHWLTLEELTPTGILEDYYYVVASRVPAKMTPAQLRREGYFVDTMSVVFQASSVENGQLVTDSAFAAGSDDGWSEDRFDGEAVQSVMQSFGENDVSTDPLDQHRRGMLIRKDHMPNGVVDLVKMYDAAIGPNRFFGRLDMPDHSYEDFRAYCIKRQARLSSVIDNALANLVANRHNILTPTDATTMLEECVKNELTELAVQDLTIESRIFGREAAKHLDRARELMLEGNYKAAESEIKKFEDKAEITGCPTGSDQEAEGERKMMNCPYCGKKKYDDPCASFLKCDDCGAAVLNGTVISRGNGGSKKRQADKAKNHQPLKVEKLTPLSAPA